MTSEIIHEEDNIVEGFRIVEKIRVIDPCEHFPEGLKYSFSIMHLINERWIPLARIDNYPHLRDRVGPHLHRLDWGMKNVSYEIILNLADIKGIREILINIAREIVVGANYG